MAEYQRKSAAKWNVMLLVGRPLAFAGCFQIGRGILDSAAGGEAVSIGVLLIVAGFVIGWTGKIGKALFFE